MTPDKARGAHGSDHQAGLLSALGGYAALSTADAVVKSMAGAWPGTAISGLRFVIGAGVLGTVIALRDGRAGFRCPRPWLQLGRGAAIALASICFFLSLHLMPIADATAIQFTSPLITGLLSGVMLREAVPRIVWGASALALAGVVVILQPNLLALGAPALLPLAAACGMSLLVIFNRKAAGTAPLLLSQFLVAAFALPVLLCAVVVGHFSGIAALQVGVPTVAVLLRCALVAGIGTLAHLLIYVATTRVPAAIMAPMAYVQLLVATVLGWMLFGDAPQLRFFGGAALIVVGGLLLWRSQTRAAPASA